MTRHIAQSTGTLAIYSISFGILVVAFVTVSWGALVMLQHIAPWLGVQHTLGICHVMVIVIIAVGGTAVAWKMLLSAVRQLFPEQGTLFAELESVRKRMLALVDMTALANVVVNTLTDVVAIRNVALLVHDADTHVFYCASTTGMSISSLTKLSLPDDDILIRTLSAEREMLYRDTVLKAQSWQDASLLSRSFAQLRAVYVVPLFFDGELIGLVALSRTTAQGTLPRHLLRYLARPFAETLALAVRNARDYTTLQRNLSDMQDVQSRLLQAAKISAIEKLASGIAHEIHNPLTIISGKAQVLLLKGDKTLDTDRVNDVLHTIVHQTKRAADITRRLLMFTKTSQDDEKKPINVESIINDTIALVSYQVALDDIKIVKVFESNIPHVEGSVFEMRELFLNLILNAIQAIGKQGSITITVQYADREGMIKISIADTGSGIAEEHLAHIFDPFYTTRSNNVGLGLFVCQQIVNRMGGAIKVESKVNAGSVFSVVLPTVPVRLSSELQSVEMRHD